MTKDLSPIEFRQLRYFVALAEVLHFGRAAERLGIAQPSLTRQIQLLEQQLGTALLQRTQRQVKLTPAGSTFLEQSRLTLEQHERAIEITRHSAQQSPLTLTLGLETCATFHGLPEMLHRFSQQYPHIKIVTYHLTAPEQEEALRRGRIDAGFLHPPIQAPEFIFEPVCTETFIAVLPTGHQLARRRHIALADLALEQFILFPRNLATSCYDIIIDLCAKAGFQPKVQLEISDMSFALNLVASGAGVTLAPAGVPQLHVSGLVYRPLTGQTPQVISGFIRRDTPSAQPLADLIERWREQGHVH